MSVENWPLKLIRDNDNSDREKYYYLEMDLPLDSNNSNGPKVSNKYKKLIHTEAESILDLIIEYDGTVEDLTISEGFDCLNPSFISTQTSLRGATSGISTPE